MASKETALETLQRQYQEKILEEKRLADRFHALCGSLQEDTRQSKKNLEAAIVASRQPGYFHYREKGAEAKRIESKGELKGLTMEIEKVERELKQLDAEIKLIQDTEHRESIVRPCRTISDWLQANGKPNNDKFEVFKSDFLESKKVYGGTKHYTSFRSGAVSMKKGRLTR